MGENLSNLSGGCPIRLYPWNRSVPVDYQLALDIYRFEADATGTVTLKAAWRIVAPGDHRLLVERRSSIEKSGTGAGVENNVERMNMALADLALEIADALINQN
jgi:uncharacterized lipoprotein YmbA